MSCQKIYRNQQGVALIWALIILLVLAIGAGAFIHLTNFNMVMARRTTEATRAFYIAQAGVEKAITGVKLQMAGNQNGNGDSGEYIVPPYYEGSMFSELTVQDIGEPDLGTLEHGTYTGLNGVAQNIRITSAVESVDVEGVTALVIQDMQTQLIPIFQFAIFYNNDLEIQPGPQMTVIGPVHSNHDIYLGSNNSLDFDSTITSSGNISHSRKEGTSSGGGSVRVKDADGAYQNMSNDDGTWLDSGNDEWVVESQTRWDGQVQSSAHQVSSLLLPLPNPDDPRAVIERPDPGDVPELAELKYYNRADLRIIDGDAADISGIPVSLDYPDPDNPGNTLNPVSQKEFNNFREGKTISVTEIDVAKLVESGNFPDNGILYVSDERNALVGGLIQDAVRLVNGEELPSQGLTVVTDRPLYIQGDFNTVNKKPASVMCDAINILSNSWNDIKSTKSSLSERVATSTEVNVAVIAGNTETTPGAYNGGVENFPRFLETWTGKTLTYRGSLVAMWESEIATGAWIYGSPYYTAPNRNWSYDTDLGDPANAPPGMPSVYTTAITLWRAE